MLQRINEGRTAYDIGANYGMHALLMAKLVGASGHIYAFEPSPVIFKGLKENIEMKSTQPRELCSGRTWDHSGRVQFLAGNHLGAGHCTEVDAMPGNGMEVEVFSLDDFVFERGHYPPDFIKIDVEGAEAKVLFGARRLLGTLPTGSSD